MYVCIYVCVCMYMCITTISVFNIYQMKNGSNLKFNLIYDH